MVKTKKIAKAPVEAPALENVTNDAAVTITEGKLDIGQNYPQGDLYFVRLPSLPASCKSRRNRQLAEGDTQGSRHLCVTGRVFDADAAEVRRMIRDATGGKADPAENYIGPVVQTEDGVAVIEHPEHGDHRYEGDQVLAVVFQRALDAEEREQRVLD